ncbi:MAG TPA: class I SAM-dependent methyltransferase [Solirubrobacterales bacterium]|nr:class I SAM-dependent methyltransferase [Solirubrobacterales bacterium]
MTACAWCGAPLSEGERLKGRIRCAHCGVATISPWPTEAELEQAYGGWYRPAAGRFSGFGDRLLRHTRGRLAARLRRIAPPGPVLDVGAGEGALIEALRREGVEASGLDPFAGGTYIRSGSLSDEEGGSWAAVVFWHSLEHLPEPAKALEEAVRLLEPGGALVIAVPNSDSLQARLFGDRWLALDPPRHLVHLTSRALQARLRQLGLRVERVSYLRGGQVVFGWLHGIVGSLPGRMDLYDAIRRKEARAAPISAPRRAAIVLAAVALLPLALAATAAEVALRRGGTVYVEARKP